MKWPGEPRLLDEEITLSQGRIKESKLSSKFGTKSTLKTKMIRWEKVWSIWVNPRELMHISLSRNTVTSSKKLRINHTSEKKLWKHHILHIMNMETASDWNRYRCHWSGLVQRCNYQKWSGFKSVTCLNNTKHGSSLNHNLYYL